MSACAANAEFSRSWGVSVRLRASVLGSCGGSVALYLLHSQGSFGRTKIR